MSRGLGSRPAAALRVALLALPWWACGDAPPRSSEPGASVAADGSDAGSIRLVDAAGATVTLPAPARRVVSLVPSATETLRAIGAGDVLVGRTDYDTQTWAVAIPSVGAGIGPSLETIVALSPDLVIRFAGDQDARTPARLDALGIPHLAVRPDRIEDIYRTARLLGAATGRSSAAEELVARLRAGLDTLALHARSLPRLRVAYVLGGTPPWVAGRGTYIDEVLSLLGGENVFGDLGALYAPVSPEELRTRSIDVVLVSVPGDYDRSLTPRARVEVAGDALEIPGPGVVAAAHHVGALLHGRSLR